MTKTQITNPRRFGIAALYLIALLALTGCASNSSDYRAMVAQIRNDRVRWEGTHVGVQVRAIGEQEQRVLTAGLACRPYLIEALGDESRYVAAHVILSQMTRTYTFSAAEWNHLQVNVLADGHVEIPPGQMPTIQAFWMQH